jgi:predicted GIY-YIG superfamily endonuclease
VYFGETADLQRRLTEHLADRGHCIHRFRPLHFSVELTPARSVRCRELVLEFSPPCNVGSL